MRALALALAIAFVLAAPLAVAQPSRIYTCPMHPEIRSPRPGACPRCEMVLVPTSADRLDTYFLDVSISPANVPVGRPLLFRFAVRDPLTRAPIRDFAIVHERPFHLFVVSEDLAWFEHVHPVPAADGSFTLTTQLPRAGRYQLIAEVIPEGSAPQLIQRAIVTAGWSRPLARAELVPSASSEVTPGGMQVSLSPQAFVATRVADVEILARELDGSAADLEPYLGADVHLLAVSADLADAFHEHGQRSPGKPGPLHLQLCFPRAGVYRLWAQLKRRGIVHTARFTVLVSPMGATADR